MKSALLALMILLMVSPLALAQHTDSEPKSFVISSLNSAFGVQGIFEGEYRVSSNRIQINLKRAEIRISETCHYKGRRLVSSVKFGLAVGTEDKSTSVLVGKEVIETKLRKRSEFQALGLVITRDELEADLILEVRHDVFTKYVYTAIDPRTQIVVASGKLSSLGGTVAGKVAKRFMKELMRARATTGP